MKVSDRELEALDIILTYIYNAKLKDDAPDVYDAYLVLITAPKEEDQP